MNGNRVPSRGGEGDRAFDLNGRLGSSPRPQVCCSKSHITVCPTRKAGLIFFLGPFIFNVLPRIPREKEEVGLLGPEQRRHD